jgi:hypothetical protein
MKLAPSYSNVNGGMEVGSIGDMHLNC